MPWARESLCPPREADGVHEELERVDLLGERVHAELVLLVDLQDRLRLRQELVRHALVDELVGETRDLLERVDDERVLLVGVDAEMEAAPPAESYAPSFSSSTSVMMASWTTSSRVPFGVLIVHSKLPDGVMPSLYMQRVTTMANASAFSSASLVTTSLRCVFLI